MLKDELFIFYTVLAIGFYFCDEYIYSIIIFGLITLTKCLGIYEKI